MYSIKLITNTTMLKIDVSWSTVRNINVDPVIFANGTSNINGTNSKRIRVGKRDFLLNLRYLLKINNCNKKHPIYKTNNIV